MPASLQEKSLSSPAGSRGSRESRCDFRAQGGADRDRVVVGGESRVGDKTIAAAGGPAPLAINTLLRKLEGCQQAFNTVKEKFNRCDVR